MSIYQQERKRLLSRSERTVTNRLNQLQHEEEAGMLSRRGHVCLLAAADALAILRTQRRRKVRR